jgi:hypothetical protein
MLSDVSPSFKGTNITLRSPEASSRRVKSSFWVSHLNTTLLEYQGAATFALELEKQIKKSPKTV